MRILAGLLLGVIFGALMSDGMAVIVAPVARPIGKLWLDSLTMTVVPLVFSLLVTGVMRAAAQAAGGRLAARALGWFAVLLVAAALVGAGVTTLLLDLSPLPASASALPRVAGAMPVLPAATNWLDNVIPTNPIRAAAESAMVPLVVFALLFGLAASGIEPIARSALTRVLDGVAQTMLRIVGWVLWIAPLGVFALAIGVGLVLGGGAAGVLAHYVAVIVGAAMATIVLAYVAAALLGAISPLAFARAALPAQVIAVSTQSSLASLPAMVAAAPALRVRNEAASVVLPLAVSLFRATTAAANVAVATYLAAVHGVTLGASTLVVGAIVGAAVSVAAVGLPAQVSFFAVIAPICLTMGVPVTLLPLLLAIETVPDIFRTLGNVTADLAVMRIVGREADRRSSD
ncbi:cation:dicarboxylase symporter family transporter [Sphingomonas sp. LR60]|uniref:dicarboxylate/amino acid:cation symporter n=1 Tax=Sphingomonas sp. LR60 TaxID=3050233 RepID=UPI002FE0397A